MTEESKIELLAKESLKKILAEARAFQINKHTVLRSQIMVQEDTGTLFCQGVAVEVIDAEEGVKIKTRDSNLMEELFTRFYSYRPNMDEQHLQIIVATEEGRFLILDSRPPINNPTNTVQE